MEYTVKELAEQYIKYLEGIDFNVKKSPTPLFDISAYNEYKYYKMLLNYEKLYAQTDSIELTEQFLKGDKICK